jgi:hypothetical protein
MRFIVVALVIASSSALAEPCFGPPALDIMVFPINGQTDMPTNATPFTSAGAKLQIGGVDVAARIDSMTMAGGFPAFQRIVPDNDFASGATVDVVLDGVRAGSFTVGADEDLGVPVISGVQLLREEHDGCNSTVVLNGIPTGVNDLMLVAKLNSTPTLEPGEVFDGITRLDELRVFGQADTPAQVHVSGVDLAGNLSEALVVDVIFPEARNNGFGGGGCSQSSTPPMMAGLIFLIGSYRWLRRRRP